MAETGHSLHQQTELDNLKKADARGCDPVSPMCKRRVGRSLFDVLMWSRHQIIMLMLLDPFVQCQKTNTQIESVRSSVYE
jgi:hypothetical protein